jgi:hypothetical protein
MDQVRHGGCRRNGGLPSRTVSLTYLQSAIKIAISLIEQINQAKMLNACGESEQLDSLSIGRSVDWAECTMVRLNDDVFKDGNKCSATTTQQQPEADVNVDLEAFLESFEKQHRSRTRCNVTDDECKLQSYTSDTSPAASETEDVILFRNSVDVTSVLDVSKSLKSGVDLIAINRCVNCCNLYFMSTLLLVF